MWTYAQDTGELLDPGERQVAIGYSGTGIGRNNPLKEAVPNVGPVPRGFYLIGPAAHSDHMGPCVMPLLPQNGETHGRSGFYIHGDNSRHDASHGCIILGPSTRQIIAESPDRLLHVVPSI